MKSVISDSRSQKGKMIRVSLERPPATANGRRSDVQRDLLLSIGREKKCRYIFAMDMYIVSNETRTVILLPSGRVEGDQRRTVACQDTFGSVIDLDMEQNKIKILFCWGK